MILHSLLKNNEHKLKPYTNEESQTTQCLNVKIAFTSDS